MDEFEFVVGNAGAIDWLDVVVDNFSIITADRIEECGQFAALTLDGGVAIALATFELNEYTNRLDFDFVEVSEAHQGQGCARQLLTCIFEHVRGNIDGVVEIDPHGFTQDGGDALLPLIEELVASEVFADHLLL